MIDADFESAANACKHEVQALSVIISRAIDIIENMSPTNGTAGCNNHFLFELRCCSKIILYSASLHDFAQRIGRDVFTHILIRLLNVKWSADERMAIPYLVQLLSWD